ncbi:3-phosphoshikimate 1-carboxyvinyltransferase, putative, partial [Perkinsus marinus ATCC 50983]
PPGGKLKARGTVDMSDLTDSFLTAAVLMALAEGESCITNVANQRVKECDRIAAMAENINL